MRICSVITREAVDNLHCHSCIVALAWYSKNVLDPLQKYNNWCFDSGMMHFSFLLGVLLFLMLLAQAKLQQRLGSGTREFLDVWTQETLPCDVVIPCVDGECFAHSFILR